MAKDKNWAFVLVRGSEFAIINDSTDITTLTGDNWRIAGVVTVPSDSEAYFQTLGMTGPQPEIDFMLLQEAAKEFTARVRDGL